MPQNRTWSSPRRKTNQKARKWHVKKYLGVWVLFQEVYLKILSGCVAIPLWRSKSWKSWEMSAFECLFLKKFSPSHFVWAQYISLFFMNFFSQRHSPPLHFEWLSGNAITDCFWYKRMRWISLHFSNFVIHIVRKWLFLLHKILPQPSYEIFDESFFHNFEKWVV